MKLRCLIGMIGLIGITLSLASNSKGKKGNFNVTIDRNQIAATLGSNVTIGCKFIVPPEHDTEKVQVFWKKQGVRSNFNTFDNDRNAFVFHPNETFVLEKYRGKTKLIGNIVKGNCSLKIFDIMENEANIFLRVLAKGDNYSFVNDFVSISVFGPGETPVSVIPDNIIQPLPTTEETDMPQETTTNYMAIFIPISALLIIVFVAVVVVCCMRQRRRSQSLSREDSGYYANFSRANQVTRNQTGITKEESYKKQENKKCPEPKFTEGPVYINLEAPPGQMDQSMDHTDHIYGNVDYTK